MSLEKNINSSLFSWGGYYVCEVRADIDIEKRGKSGNKTKMGKNNEKFCLSLPTTHIFSFLQNYLLHMHTRRENILKALNLSPFLN